MFDLPGSGLEVYTLSIRWRILTHRIPATADEMQGQACTGMTAEEFCREHQQAGNLGLTGV